MYYNLKTRYITEYNDQPIDKEILIKLLQFNAVQCPFSIFGYIKGNNSKQCLKKTQSGNCIALSLNLQNILASYGIKSVLIPASIPKMYQHPQYLFISHVALCIPYQTYAYILDPAFYFKEPMLVHFNDTTSVSLVNSHNIYENKNNIVQYKLQPNFQDLYLNEYQTVPKETYFIETNYLTEPNDKWYYFLVELVNPDTSISSTYISIKRYPFITTLNEDYSIDLYVKFLRKDYVVIKKNYQIIFEGHPKDVPLNILKLISKHGIDLNLPKNIDYKQFLF